MLQQQTQEVTKEHRATISFHLTQSEKKQLLEKALSRFGTLSDYIRYRLLIEEDAKSYINDIQTQKEKVGGLLSQTEQLRGELTSLTERINFYESGRLAYLLEKCRGQHVKFKSPSGEIIDLEIQSMQDMFTVIVNSFKDD